MAEREAGRKRYGLPLKIKLIPLLLLAAVVFFLGLKLGGHEGTPKITSDLLSEQLSAVQELVSVQYNYTNMGKFENQVDFYGWKVPFTTKSFIVSYDGVIKAGVDLSAVEIQVNELSHTVTLTLPKAEILSHEIPEDSIQVFDESHNIFNPISIEDYTGFTHDQKMAVEQRVVEKGLLEDAAEKAQTAIRSSLSLLPGMKNYTITVK